MRYTINKGGKWIVPKEKWPQAAGKLARYEDTDLDPKQIRAIDKLYAEKCAEVGRLKAELKTAHDRKKTEVMVFLDWIDGQILDDPVAEIRNKLEEIL